MSRWASHDLPVVSLPIWSLHQLPRCSMLHWHLWPLPSVVCHNKNKPLICGGPAKLKGNWTLISLYPSLTAPPHPSKKIIFQQIKHIFLQKKIRAYWSKLKIMFFHMVSLQTIFAYPFHHAKLQILLHGVTANSLYLSFLPCKATNLTTWCRCKQTFLLTKLCKGKIKSIVYHPTARFCIYEWNRGH